MVNWSKLIRLGLLVSSAFMLITGLHDSLRANLTMRVTALVGRVERDPYNEFTTHNFIVHYTFNTAQKGITEGQYLFENALTIGDVPRRGSAVQVAYSAYDPSINQPQDGEDIEYALVFQAVVLLCVGSVLLLAGFYLR
jgi:hypothetical protein